MKPEKHRRREIRRGKDEGQHQHRRAGGHRQPSGRAWLMPDRSFRPIGRRAPIAQARNQVSGLEDRRPDRRERPDVAEVAERQRVGQADVVPVVDRVLVVHLEDEPQRHRDERQEEISARASLSHELPRRFQTMPSTAGCSRSRRWGCARNERARSGEGGGLRGDDQQGAEPGTGGNGACHRARPAAGPAGEAVSLDPAGHTPRCQFTVF